MILCAEDCDEVVPLRDSTLMTFEPDLPLSTPPLSSSNLIEISHQVSGLFAGIAGLELGLSRAGHSTNLLCEIDPAAQAVLCAHNQFFDAPLHHDVRKLSGKDLKGTTLLTAGFPCQDFSPAGRTQGITGKNSGLIGEVFRLLHNTDVPEVLLENVPFMMQLHRGAALDIILTEFEKLGYSWAYRVVDAMAFAIPQRRLRIFILASKLRDPRTVLLSGRTISKPEDHAWSAGSDSMGFYWTEGNRGVGWAINSVPTLKGGSTVGIPSPPAVLLPCGRVVTPTIQGAERLQGFRANWTQAAAGVTRESFRWKLVGNAINVKVARWLGDRLAKPKSFSSDSYRPLLQGAKWPLAAWCINGARRWTDDTITTFPVSRTCLPIHEFLGNQVQPLSEKALAGFTSRLKKSSLRTPDEFIPALETALKNRREEMAD